MRYLTRLIAPILFNCFVVTTSQILKQSVNHPAWVLQKFFNQCSHKDELIKCLKIQALKVTDRALNLKHFNVVDGLDIVGNGRIGKSVSDGLQFNETKLEKLSHDDLDSLLGDRALRFLDTHKVEVNIPKLLQETGRSFSEESRSRRGRGKGSKKDKGGNYLPLFAALAIKGSFLALAYKGIAVMSGTALIIGKMALILSAILGLKKLVSDNQEKTTFEIIKAPKYTEEHIHSEAYGDEHHDHYRRNYLDTGEVQKRVYRFKIHGQ